MADWIKNNIDREYAVDEVAADYIGELMRSDRELRSLSKRPGLVQRMLRAAERLANGRSVVEQSEYKLLANRLREIAGAGAVSEGRSVSGDGVRYSIKNTRNMSIEEQLKSLYAGELKTSDALYFGSTPPSLSETGLSPLPLAWAVSEFNKSKTEKHFVPRRIIKNISKLLEDAVFAVVSTDGSQVAVMTDEIDGNGKPLIVAIHANQIMDRSPVNRIKSAYGLSHFKEWYKNQTETLGKHIVVIDKKRTSQMLQTIGQQLPKVETKAYSDVVQEPHRGVTENGSLADATSTASDNIIFQEEAKSNKRFSVEEYSEQERAEHCKTALAHFGETIKWSETGYLLADGKKLDFSGKHDGGPGGYRAVDHRDISDALGLDYGGGDYSDAMIQFMAEGNIRISPENDGINLSVAPTKAQERALNDFITKAGGEVTLDIDKPGGDTVISVEYPEGTRANKVLNDIREYFESGKEPYVSDVSRFRYSLEEEVVEQAKEMLAEGRKPSEIYNATGLFAMADGSIADSTGKVLYSPDGSDSIVSQGGEDHVKTNKRGLDLGTETSQSVLHRKRGAGEVYGGRNNDFSRSDGNQARVNWEFLQPGKQREVIEALGKRRKAFSEEANELLDVGFKGSVSDMAEAIYGDYAKSPVIVEHRWKNFIPDIDEMLREFDEIAWEGKTRYSVEEAGEGENGNRSGEENEERRLFSTDELNTKAAEYLKRAENAFVKKLLGIFEVPKFKNRAAVKGVVSEISEEYLSAGRVANASLKRLADTAWKEAVKVDKEFYDEYQWLKDELRSSAIVVSEAIKGDIADYDDWRKRQFGRLNIVKSGGLPVDVKYQELSEKAPGLFPADIINPSDQLRRMSEVAQSIVKTERNLNQTYGVDAEFFKKAAENDIKDVFIDYFQNELIAVKKYSDRRAAENEKKSSLMGLVAEGLNDRDVETVKELWTQAKEAKRLVERAVSKNLLTEADEAAVKKLLGGGLTLETLPDGLNTNGIRAVYEARAGYERAMAGVRNYNQNRKAALREEADFYLNNSGKWKDKSAGWKYSRETMERNIRDIVADKDTADAVVKRYFEPVHKNEAERTRLKNDYRRRVKELELDRKRHKGDKLSEAAAVQLYGEALDNIEVLSKKKGGEDWRNGHSLAEWRSIAEDVINGNPSLDMEKIRGAVEAFSQIYDELFERMNAFLMIYFSHLISGLLIDN